MRSSVKFEYDSEVDAAYLRLRGGKVAVSQEVKPGLILDLDQHDQIVGVEILRFSRRFARQMAFGRAKNGRRKMQTTAK
jgi:uncharacterized protein YuzE